METIGLLLLFLIVIGVPFVVMHFKAGGVSVRFDRPRFPSITNVIRAQPKEEIVAIIPMIFLCIVVFAISVVSAIYLFDNWLLFLGTLPFVVMAFMVLWAVYNIMRNNRK